MFSAPFRECLRCVTRAVVLAKGHDPTGGPYILTIVGQQGPAHLGGPHAIGLAVTHLYAVVPAGEAGGPWRVSNRAYNYELTTGDRLLLRYDWHPTGRSQTLRPHVHLRGHTAPIDLTRAHLPSGRVSLESVIEFAIEELRVPPLRRDWRTVLQRAEQAFDQARTW